ncbi:actin, clone 302-like isoform X2 [Ostrea edulis]|uniref:actin, clone 302-like isoform X2 n=1 Tax=Ostrea edulis TaxID=37623 RepID=UPI0024AF8BCA|nr:actin, clone 302-like isoform X2 [Ostrea edulis]
MLDLPASSEVEFYIGNEAQARREILAMTSPIDRGIVTNWEDMEQLWQYVFTGTLGVSPEEHNVLNSEISFMPKACKEVMLQLLMEKFNVQGYNAQLQGVLAAIAYGHTSSLILECGEGVAQAFPVYESYAFPDTIKSMEIAGKDVTMSLQKLLYEKGYSFTTYSEIEAVREIKERYCSIRPDKMASQSEEEVIYTLPDGQQITIGDERFEAPEVLFRSSLLGYDTGELGGIQDLVHASLQACDSYCRRDLYFNVLLSGGTTLLPGFKERLLQELSSKAPCRVKVWADPARKFMVWIGGSIYASLSFCENKWITRSEYSEHGPNIIHRKCQLAANTKLT